MPAPHKFVTLTLTEKQLDTIADALRLYTNVQCGNFDEVLSVIEAREHHDRPQPLLLREVTTARDLLRIAKQIVFPELPGAAFVPVQNGLDSSKLAMDLHSAIIGYFRKEPMPELLLPSHPRPHLSAVPNVCPDCGRLMARTKTDARDGLCRLGIAPDAPDALGDCAAAQHRKDALPVE